VLIVGETFQLYQALALVLVLAASGWPNTAEEDGGVTRVEYRIHLKY